MLSAPLTAGKTCRGLGNTFFKVFFVFLVLVYNKWEKSMQIRLHYTYIMGPYCKHSNYWRFLPRVASNSATMPQYCPFVCPSVCLSVCDVQVIRCFFHICWNTS